jgi:hypothetical protein
LKPSSDFSPIAEQGELKLEAGLFSKLRRRREIAPVSPGFVRVLLDAEGTPLEELTAGQKYWSKAQGWVKVDVRNHSLEYEISFPDPSGLAGFIATVDVAAVVCDPKEAVAQGAESVEDILRPTLQSAIRKAHNGLPSPDGGADPVAVLNTLRLGAAKNLEDLVKAVPNTPKWLSATVTSVAVQLDDATERHRSELVEKFREVALANADGQSDAAKARNRLEVHKIWEEGFANRLADPEKRALARIAADPSRENIDRVAGEFDQIEAQGRAAIVEVLREAVNKGYFAEDDAIYNTISAMEKQYGNQHHALGGGESPKQVDAAAGDEVIEVDPVDTEETAAEDSEGREDEDGSDDANWSQ